MITEFQNLRRAVEVIARHRDYPGKQDLVRDGLEDLDDLHRRGRLTEVEKDRLRAILLATTERSRRHEEMAYGPPR